MINRFIILAFFSILICQYPVSDQGEDQIVEPGQIVTISGANSYALEGNSIASYLWTVPQEILDVNPDLDLNSAELVFTAPNVSSSSIFSITLEVTDSQGNKSQDYDSNSLLISEYSETSTSVGSQNKYIELFNGTGQTITQNDWMEYEIWLTFASSGISGEFLNPNQRFRHKLFFHRIPTEVDEGNNIDLSDMYTIYPGDLAHGETLLIVQRLETADADLVEHSPLEWDDISDLSGDEAIALVKNGLPIDAIGEGIDPGSAWSVGGVSNATKDHVLVRKSTVVLGNYPNWYESAGCADIELDPDDPCPSSESSLSEWIVNDDADFLNAGSHSCTACDNSVNVVVAVPPVADAGEDFITCQEIVTLTSSSSSFGDGYTFSWTGPGAIPLTNANSASPNFSSPTSLSQDTQYCFSLTVNDGYVNSDPDEVCVTVNANLCPVSNAGPDKNYRVNQQDEIVLSASGSYDPNALDILSFTWAPIGNSSDLILSDQNVESLTVSGFPEQLNENPTDYYFELRVEDQGSQPAEPDTVKISIADFSYPKSPNLYAVPYSDNIKLSWDFVSEASIDPLTKYADFEGYRLYRSEDGGQNWCSAEDKIYDFEGNDVGCQPIAQFDLTENQDFLHCVYKPGYSDCQETRGENVSEYDPVDGWIYLGDNSGLEHIYIDENVIEGKQYTYTLTAYDTGLRTYSFDYETNSNSSSVGEPYQDVGSDGCSDAYETGLNGECTSTENPDNGDLNGDNYDASTGSGTEGNGIYDVGEPFTDSNENGVWDGDPIYTQQTKWSQSNPDQWTSIGQNDNINSVVNTNPDINSSYRSLESPLGIEGSNNFVKAVAGALPTNISEPDIDKSNDFILAETNNIGNGNRYFDIVDRSELQDVTIKFEVQAEYGVNDNGTIVNSFEANKNENPTLYGWVIDASGNPTEIVEVQVSDLSSSTTLSAELDLPGVELDGNKLIYPHYLVEGMPIAFSDELGADENWTEVLYGTRFKFDNNFFFYQSTIFGTEYIPPLRDAFTVEASEDSTLLTSLFISDSRKTQIYYFGQQIFDMRPPYSYKIEFSDTPEFQAWAMEKPSEPYAGNSCSAEEDVTMLPFRVTNLYTGSQVRLSHQDFGKNMGLVEDEEGNISTDNFADGRKDCFWTRSEQVYFNEDVSTYNIPFPHQISNDNAGEADYTYILDLDYFMFKEFRTPDWDSSIQYSEGDEVLHQSMIWEATDVIPNFIPPPSGSDSEGKKGWFDCGADLKCNQEEEGFDASLNPDPEGDDYDSIANPSGKEGDGFNDNPWAPRYPWKAPRCTDSQYTSEETCTNANQTWEYDTFYFTPFAWYSDGDSWTVDLGEIGKSNAVDSSTLSEVTVVPNPYRAGSVYNSDYNDETIYFKNLPSTCQIKIFTVTGKLVTTIDFDSSNSNGSGQFDWHLTNSDGNKVAPGLYIYYVESGAYNQVGKFAIVR